MNLIEFRQPLLLLLAILAFPAFFLAKKNYGRLIFSSIKLWETNKSSFKTKTSFIPPLLIALTFVFLAIALAGPRIPGGIIKQHSQGISIMVTVDKSSSMLALDMSTKDRELNRMDALKELLIDFINGDNKDLKGRTNDAIGIVSFAGFPESNCPLTLDHISLTEIAKELEIVELREDDGTNIGDALALSIERLRQAKTQTKVIILLSDGENNTGNIAPLEAAKLATNYGIKIYTIGIGTNGMAKIKLKDPFSGHTEIHMVSASIDEKTMNEIASLTNGKYFRATDHKSLHDIYKTIDQLEKSKISETRYTTYDEKFTIFLLLAAISTIISLLLSATYYRQSI